jgi:hypothetical protein
MASIVRPRPGDSSQVLRPSVAQTTEISRLDIFDCQSVFEVVDVIRQFKSIAGTDQPGPTPNFDYRACFEILQESRQHLGFTPSQNTLAVATVDPESEGQGRFITAISRLGVLVEPVDFRDASVTLPLMGDSDRTERRYVRSLAPNITYVLGLLASRPSPEVVVVTRTFELFGSLRDFVEKRGGKAAIAFFRRYLDARFGIAGLFEADSKVKFIDLEPHSERILGCDVRQIATGPRSRTQGIAGL